jgi:hypothetical protein
MRARRFALSVLFVLLAMAGDAGALLKSMHHEEERCLVGENASRPAAKTSSIRSRGEFRKSYIARRLIRKNPRTPRSSYANSFLNNPPVSRFRILLI